MGTLLMDVTSKGSRASRILIADDQADVLEALGMLLKQHGYEAVAVNSPAAILRALEAGGFDALLMDLNYTRDTTSGEEGLTLLSQIHAMDETLPVVVMTAWGTVELAVEAMHKGVGDFVLKPWDNTRLLAILRTQIEEGQARRKTRQLKSKRDILGDEILEAREIQEGLLPKEMPRLPGYEICGAWEPTRIVGGDYFDVFEVNDSMIALCIADVVGKGLPAALLMSNLQAGIRGAAGEALQPKDLCAKVNRATRANVAADKFITLFYGLLDVGGHRLIYTNAGHNPPFLVRQDGSHLRLLEGGTVIGVLRDGTYVQDEVQLCTGDRLVLFTDGVTEARSPEDEEFGEERLFGLLVENRHLGARDLQNKILGDVSDFCRGNFHDDATLIVVAVQL